ncbi:MAG: anaerobic glycerol-3-phosphate dehydrogenase subunit B [Candidatus Thorarchaeota archaeon]|nr:MAG: anaerobic glycerol-3-phosphate dehydrogenase subunit B [Candidatus Thorarchaeota archaeon]
MGGDVLMDIEADLLVIGGGMAGLVAGIVAAEGGLETVLVRKGQSATAYSSGAIDVIGYLPEASEPFITPEEGLTAIAGLYPLHPYSVVGYAENVTPEKVVDAVVERSRESVNWLRNHLDGTIATLVGDFSTNILPITILGTTKPTCLIQKTMDPGDVQEREDSTLLFAGIMGHPDFYPASAAKTYLEDRIAFGLPSRKVAHCTIQVAPFGNSVNVSGIEIARHLDHDEALDDLAEQLKEHVDKVGATHVALPPILGLKNAVRNQTNLKQEIGADVFELLGFPPSVPGLRLQLALERIFRKAGGRLLIGHEVISFLKKDDQLKHVTGRAPQREIKINAKAYVLATGKFIGNGLVGDERGIRETIFGLMTVTGSYYSAGDTLPSKATNRVSITSEGQPIYSTGLTVDPQFRPIQEDGVEWVKNLFAAGSVLAGYNYSVEKSGLGVAVTSGFSAAMSAISYVKEVP